jgi:hypothetical protein
LSALCHPEPLPPTGAAPRRRAHRAQPAAPVPLAAPDWTALQGQAFSSPVGRLTLEAVRAHRPEAGWASYTLTWRADLPVAAGLLALQHPLTGTVWLHLERDGPGRLRADRCQPLAAPG